MYNKMVYKMVVNKIVVGVVVSLVVSKDVFALTEHLSFGATATIDSIFLYGNFFVFIGIFSA